MFYFKLINIMVIVVEALLKLLKICILIINILYKFDIWMKRLTNKNKYVSAIKIIEYVPLL